jgi:outer membrane protein assembly factor BamB
MVLAVLVTACHKRPLPPVVALFPVANAWVSLLEGVGEADPGAIEGPLGTDGSRIVVATRGGLIYALDAATGALQWRVTDRAGTIASDADAVLLRQADGTVWRMDSATGATRWKKDTAVGGTMPPLIDGRRVLVGGDGLAALDIEMGDVAWKRAGKDTSPISTPLVVERGFLLFGRGDGALEAVRKNNGKPVWTYGAGKPLVAPPMVDDRDRVLFGTTKGGFEAVSLEKGTHLWRWRVGADVRSGSIVFKTRVLFASFENVIYSLDRGRGHMIWRTALPSRPMAAPILVGSNLLVVCADNELVSLDPATGKLTGNLAIRMADGAAPVIRTPPLVLKGRLYLGVSNPVAVLALALPAKVAP